MPDTFQFVTEPFVVSEGTLKDEDLFEAFVSVLEDLNDPDALNFRQIWEEAAKVDNPILVQETRGWILWENLFDTLNEHCGEGIEFGAHPGDGACFGFWQVEEDE